MVSPLIRSDAAGVRSRLAIGGSASAVRLLHTQCADGIAPAARAATGFAVSSSQMAKPSAATTWTCATCGRPYPGAFAVCPIDATPQGDSSARAGDALFGQVLGRAYRVERTHRE